MNTRIKGSRVEKKQSKEPPKMEKQNMSFGDLILVHVNNRLGTKSAIRCSPADSIKDFKRLVAHQLGVRPDEILLKRQGQRPFKDSLTLQDYEIGHNSSIDLEVDSTD